MSPDEFAFDPDAPADPKTPRFPNLLGGDDRAHRFRNYVLYEVDPIKHPISSYLRNKIWEVYSQVIFHAIHVSNDYLRIVVNPDDPKEGIQKINHFVAAIISAYLMKGSVTLASGGPGSGKTSTIRAISRLMTGSSITDTKNIVHCDKGTVKESWLGRLDLLKIQKGQWGIQWADWVENPEDIDLIVDEVNRASPDFQAQALLLCADQKVQYDVHFTKLKPEIRVFMTINPHDEELGTAYVYELGYALRDRVTQSLDVAQADSYAMDRISHCRHDERFLGYNQDDTIEPVLAPNELRIATILAAKMPIEPSAYQFAKYLSRDAAICLRAPNFDKSKVKVGFGLCENCHFKTDANICQRFTGGSMRMYQQLLALGQGYAFWLGMSAVTSSLLQAIAPDVVTHHLHIEADALKNDKSYYGDVRKFVRREYVDKCFERIDTRAPMQEKFRNLLDGKGKLGDLEEIIEMAREDLYIATDILPYVAEFENTADDIYGSGGLADLDSYKISTKLQKKEISTCADTEFVSVMQDVGKLMASDDLDAVMAKVEDLPPMHLQSLIQDQLYATIHQLIMKRAKKEWMEKKPK